MVIKNVNKLLMNNNKQLIKDVILIYLLLFISIIFRYFFPAIFGNVYFLVLLIISFLSKKDYFWIPFYLLLFSIPGYLFFSEGDFALPSLNITSLGREIYYNEIACIVFILKALIRKPRTIPIFYNKSLFLILGYSIILLIFGFFLGSSFLKILRTLRFLLPLLLLFVIPKLVFTQEEKVLRFVNILFSLVFFCIIAQLIDIVFGMPLATFFGETKIIFSGNELATDKIIFDVNTQVVRTVYGVYILFVSFIAGLFYTVSGSPVWRRSYLYIIIALCFLSVFLSATRGWIIAFSTILVLYFLFFPKNLRISLSGVLIIISLILFSPKIEKQIAGSLVRFETMNLMLKGDETAGGTLERITVRGPKVLTKFRESPVFGFGFSDEYYKYADGHVGNQTLLLNGGIIGYLIYSFFWLVFIWGMYKGGLYSKSLYIFIFAFLGLFIIHSSSRIIFSYALDVETAIGLGVFFAFSNYYLQKYKLIKNLKYKT
jgi:hypothetical protein